jgi:hypothetical protein
MDSHTSLMARCGSLASLARCSNTWVCTQHTCGLTERTDTQGNLSALNSVRLSRQDESMSRTPYLQLLSFRDLGLDGSLPLVLTVARKLLRLSPLLLCADT